MIFLKILATGGNVSSWFTSVRVWLLKMVLAIWVDYQYFYNDCKYFKDRLASILVTSLSLTQTLNAYICTYISLSRSYLDPISSINNSFATPRLPLREQVVSESDLSTIIYREAIVNMKWVLLEFMLCQKNILWKFPGPKKRGGGTLTHK